MECNEGACGPRGDIEGWRGPHGRNENERAFALAIRIIDEDGSEDPNESAVGHAGDENTDAVSQCGSAEALGKYLFDNLYTLKDGKEIDARAKELGLEPVAPYAEALKLVRDNAHRDLTQVQNISGVKK